MEARRLPGGFLLVDLQAVDLHQARIGLERLHIDLCTGNRPKQPFWRGRAHDNARVSAKRTHGANQFNVPRGVTESMT